MLVLGSAVHPSDKDVLDCRRKGEGGRRDGREEEYDRDGIDKW